MTLPGEKLNFHPAWCPWIRQWGSPMSSYEFSCPLLEIEDLPIIWKYFLQAPTNLLMIKIPVNDTHTPTVTAMTTTMMAARPTIEVWNNYTNKNHNINEVNRHLNIINICNIMLQILERF